MKALKHGNVRTEGKLQSVHLARRLVRWSAVAGVLFVLSPVQATPRTSAQKLGSAFQHLEAGEFAKALKIATAIRSNHILNTDYRLYIMAQANFFTRKYRRSLALFRKLAKISQSRFARTAQWRVADCLWQLGHSQRAQTLYRKRIQEQNAERSGDLAVARLRIAQAARKNVAAAIPLFREVVRRHPAHPVESSAQTYLSKTTAQPILTPDDRIARAQVLTQAHQWRKSIQELAQIGNNIPKDIALQRDYWTGMTLFRMRRNYKRAGDLLLGIYPKMGKHAAKALFHGARALSRADFDDQAIHWYQTLVSTYPTSRWAAEAQFLSGWLKYNMAQYQQALPYFAKMREKYPKSRWAAEAKWFAAYSQYLLGNYSTAYKQFRQLAQHKGKLRGNKGRYWQAKVAQHLGQIQLATATYQEVIWRHPFSWYALLSHAQLKQLGVSILPIEKRPSLSVPSLSDKVSKRVSEDPLLRRVRELSTAGMHREAGVELRRGEKRLIKRYGRIEALSALMQYYQTAGNYNRPWMLSVIYGKTALHSPPTGAAQKWWHYAYPRAYEPLLKKWNPQNRVPLPYLLSIMRKESGYNPHTRSYAEALGLLQMIPPTTKRISSQLGLPYSEDFLFDPENNIRVGSWYISKLFYKFSQQIPIAAGSYNSGPRPVMRWLDTYGKRPMDEFVELVAYRQTREYMKKVTETYARYLYLYDKVVYDQPLAVHAAYQQDSLTY